MTRIFISHSHSDEAIAFKLVNFLLAALRVEEEEILCTSNPDQGLAYSSNSITDQLKNQLKNSEAIIILITGDSLHSPWIPFEAGSFWTTDKPIIPILGIGLTQNDLPGPLKSFLSIAIATPDFTDKLNSAINQLADKLQIEQRFTTRRNHTLKEFSQHLQDWQSKYPKSNTSQQQQVEELTRQLEGIKITSLQEKEQIKQSYENKIQELQQSYQEQKQLAASLRYQIQNLEQQLEQLKPTTIVSEIAIETDDIAIQSANDVDYTKLCNFLKKQQWKEADQETTKVMLKAANREGEYLRHEDIMNFPSSDLRTINQLWLQYSQNKFGFSTQYDIYSRLGSCGKRNEEVWEQFSYIVGWRHREKWLDYSELTFDLNLSFQGHLPTVWKNIEAHNKISFFFLLSIIEFIIKPNIK